MLHNILYLVVGEIALVLGFVLNWYVLVSGPVLALQTTLATVSVWTVLTAIAPILAPLLALALTVVGKIVWNQEMRIRSLEQGETRQSRTLYGDEGDPQQSGLAHDINKLSTRVDKLERTIGELRDEIQRMNDNDE